MRVAALIVRYSLLLYRSNIWQQTIHVRHWRNLVIFCVSVSQFRFGLWGSNDMSQLTRIALAVCFFACVIVNPSDAQAKPKKSRSKNNRRCLSACLRRINKLERVCVIKLCTKSYVAFSIWRGSVKHFI